MKQEKSMAEQMIVCGKSYRIRNGALPSGEEEIRNEEATFAPACTSTILMRP